MASHTSNSWIQDRAASYVPDVVAAVGLGQASSVTEDVGGIARTTQTLDYDSSGRAIEVQDASGKQFHTNYDADGQILSVFRIDGGNQMVAEYAYGTTPWVSGDPIVEYGQVTSVTDGLSGVTQDITYTTAGAGIGRPAAVTETNGSDSYIRLPLLFWGPSPMAGQWFGPTALRVGRPLT